MKTTLLFCLSLITFIYTAAPTAITFDLVGSQTITAGTNVAVQVSVLAATNPMTLKTLTGLKLKKDASTSVDLTCTIAAAGISCTAGTAATVPCTATLSVAGSYTLDGTNAAFTATESDGTTGVSGVTPTYGNTAATVNAASNNGGSNNSGSNNSGSNNSGSNNSGSGDNDEDGSNYIRISFILLLFGFLL